MGGRCVALLTLTVSVLSCVPERNLRIWVFEDTDGDGQLTENDVVRLLRYFFLGDEPPAMGLGCTPIEGCPASCGG